MRFFDDMPLIVGPEPDSPIAERMERALLLHLNPKFELHREFPCPTPWANFRVDIVLTDGTTRIGIECDGEEFHDQSNDETRDSMILGLGLVDTIWRFKGASINFAVHDCLCLLSKIDAHVFTERRCKVLHTQACGSVRDFQPEEHDSLLCQRYDYGEPNIRLEPRFLSVVRNSRLPKWSSPRAFWRSIFDEVKDWTHLKFADVLDKRRQELHAGVIYL